MISSVSNFRSVVPIICFASYKKSLLMGEISSKKGDYGCLVKQDNFLPTVKNECLGCFILPFWEAHQESRSTVFRICLLINCLCQNETDLSKLFLVGA